jgi:HK97 family phage major capsid protein
MRNLVVLESTTQATVARVRAAIDEIRDRARNESRPESSEERAEIDRLLTEAQTAKQHLTRAQSDEAIGRRVAALGTPGAAPAPGLTPRDPLIVAPYRAASWGQHFATNASVREFIQAGGHRRTGGWATPVVEIPIVAATLTSDPASGGDLIVPDFRPGIVPGVTYPLTLADLFAPGTTDSNLVTYMREASFTNAADPVAEGTTKPESALTFDAVSDPVRKLAHWLPVTEEMLEDVPQLRSYIDSRLSLGLRLVEEDQLLNGTTTAPDIVGIRNRTGLAPDVVRGSDTVPDAIAKQISAIFNATGFPPDGVVMNPSDWLGVQLLKDDTGAYLGSGPFVAPASATIWGLPTAVTSVIPVGVALVGCFKTAAQIFRKGGIRIEASNSHQDFFVKNLVAIRAEERLALAVYRPACFGEVTGLNT